MGKKRKFKPRLLGPDDDLLQAFSRKPGPPREGDSKRPPLPVNRHGLPVVDKGFLGKGAGHGEGTQGSAQAFAELLESYLARPVQQKKNPSPDPMPYHKRIKRYPPPEKELDLHGFTALEAQMKARAFLTVCKHQGYLTVRIIVGRGLHSDLGPVLPDTIEDLLAQLKQQDIVLGFNWERKKKSRSGAVIVYLRQFSD